MIFSKVKTVYKEFPGTFWTLMTALFIDRLGGALMFPFFALYITQHFGVGMTEVGILFVIFSATGFVGSFVAGAMTDKFGRRWMLMFGLVVSALSSLLIIFVDDLAILYVLGGVIGLFAEAGGPAQQAMVADLLPEEKYAEGYGMMRVVANLAVTIGPAIGGLLAARSFALLFVIDAISSIITAVVVYFLLPETKPESAESEAESFGRTMLGYRLVLKDLVYMAFLLVSMLGIVVYIQMYSTLSVYLNVAHGIDARGYGYLMSLNAGMVVLFQFWVTRRIHHRPPLIMLATGTAIFGVGFLMYGFVTSFVMFMVAMALITVGEMVITPIGQALVAQFASEDMRGRYMALFGFSWSVPSAVGPLLAGVIMDNYDPNWVWYASGIMAAVAVTGYLVLHSAVKHRLHPIAPAELGALPAAAE